MAHDVQLDNNGDIPIRTAYITGPDLVRQRIKIRLNTWRGEWFLDQRLGLPFLEWKQQKPPDVNVIRALIQREIRTTPGVVGVANLEVSLVQGRIEITGRIAVEDVTLDLSAEISGPQGNSQPVMVLFS